MSRLSGVSANPGEVELADETFSPQKVLKDRELASKIQLAINSLPGILRITFILREFEDLSYRELARIFRCSMGTIKSRLSRARENLRQTLTPYLK
jgi:RNA polymerase sigma-70 factor (ECF subfamily)